MNPAPFKTETTGQGEQSLVPGVRPVTPRDRLQSLMNSPLRSRRERKPCNVGLFDEDARRQLDMFDCALIGRA